MRVSPRSAARDAFVYPRQCVASVREQPFGPVYAQPEARSQIKYNFSCSMCRVGKQFVPRSPSLARVSVTGPPVAARDGFALGLRRHVFLASLVCNFLQLENASHKAWDTFFCRLFTYASPSMSNIQRSCICSCVFQRMRAHASPFLSFRVAQLPFEAGRTELPTL